MSIKQLMNLEGRVALVSGGSRGLGLQMAEALGEMGASVAITARKQHELDEAREHLEKQGVHVCTVAADLSQRESIPAVVEQVVAELGPVNILVNNAGTTWGAPAEEYPDEGWDKVMRLNIDALFFLTREVARRCMIGQGGGRVINVASIAGLKGGMGMKTIAYNTSKGAVVNFTRALAAEWGPHDITVNALCPGFFPSKMSRGVLEEVGQSVIARTPMGRLGSDEDLKGITVLLASDAARHITGQNIAVDGGYSVA